MSDDGILGTDWAPQPLCVHCLRGQPLAALPWVSAGVRPCVWCRRMSDPMSRDAYDEILIRKGVLPDGFNRREMAVPR